MNNKYIIYSLNGDMFLGVRMVKRRKLFSRNFNVWNGKYFRIVVWGNLRKFLNYIVIFFGCFL